jgi:6-pyruvoyltetrahydropterin/6-carboxytetrahydropterin synthase
VVIPVTLKGEVGIERRLEDMRLEIDGEHANIKFSACHFIAGHEKCGRLHGHTYVVSVRIHGDIGEEGMVMDFVQIKRGLRRIVEDLDHRVLLPANSKRITVSLGEEVVVMVGHKRYVFPNEDVVLLDTEESSAEELSRVLLHRLIGLVVFPSNVESIELGVHEEIGQSAWACHRFR